ncbi:Metal-dependent hydrolase of the beta-lactamase superfamily I [Minicystis rosea]|nr:Metal-dependent hydrolase of the beta-lactamase superfamily I [Minicystis rosea]
MQVRFFGVRGSVPTPGSATVRYGGNTVCVEARLADGSVVILDGGTGLRELGKVLLSEGHRGPLSVLLTHVHYDHIIGLPFFGPLWRRDTTMNIYPLANDAHQDSARRRALFDGVHFPVRGSDIPARMDLIEPGEGAWRIGSALVRRIGLSHPGGAQGFRIDDDDGSSLAYLTDNELAPAGSGSAATEALARFASGVNVLIHDAQYDEPEMTDKRGWGHSSLLSVLELGRMAETAHLILFHHDPDRDDEALDAFGARARWWLNQQKSPTRATVAHEGLVLRLDHGTEPDAAPAPSTRGRASSR